MGADRFGRWSGVDFLRQVHANVALSSQFSAGVMTKTDPRFDPKMVEVELNEVMKDLYMKLAADEPQRVVAFHNFTYPSHVEHVTLNVEDVTAPGYPNPALVWPWLDLRQVFYYPTNGTRPILIQRVNFEEFWKYPGARWAYQHNAIYYTENWRDRGPNQDRALRLYYTPKPEPIDVTSTRPLTRIPDEFQDVAAKRTALVLLTQMRVKGTEGLAQLVAQREAVALRSVSQTVDGRETLVVDDVVLDTADNF